MQARAVSIGSGPSLRARVFGRISPETSWCWRGPSSSSQAHASAGDTGLGVTSVMFAAPRCRTKVEPCPRGQPRTTSYAPNASSLRRVACAKNSACCASPNSMCISAPTDCCTATLAAPLASTNWQTESVSGLRGRGHSVLNFCLRRDGACRVSPAAKTGRAQSPPWALLDHHRFLVFSVDTSHRI